ncbi:MAG: 30S ribosomal protein S20 [Gemmataceae bacterium]|nr:30S ribosomal protein S20 [Gemmataceae bacterium]MCI0739757.1 30S ribosomal protein S20 [Gemmataceae bacterium]
MPHTSSAKKSLRQTTKRRLRNRAAKKAIRIQVKNVTQAPKEATLDDLRKELVAAFRKLDKAAAKRVIHPNAAARKKAQLQKLYNSRASAGK